MQLIVTNDHSAMGERAAQVLLDIVTRKPDATLGLTTGNTPVSVYARLVQHFTNRVFLTRFVHVFSTEEYLGIGEDHPQSLFRWLKRSFLTPCEVDDSRTYRVRGDDPEPQIACGHFDSAIRQRGGLDCLMEGIGVNGHIGFNEPGSLPEYPTRVVSLQPETVRNNRHYWGDDIPLHGITIGMDTILSAKTIVLIASGAHKAYALSKAFKGPVTPEVPASFLQRAENLIVVADRQAASLL